MTHHYHQILEIASSLLARIGFKRKRKLFLRELSNCWQLMEIQLGGNKSQFTINLGVKFKAIDLFLDRQVSIPQLWTECHWYSRIGHILPENRDIWWKCDTDFSVSDFSRVFHDLVGGSIVPILETIADEDEICRMWSSDSAPGLGPGEENKLTYLSVLLLLHKDLPALQLAIVKMEELASRPYGGILRKHIERIENHLSKSCNQ